MSINTKELIKMSFEVGLLIAVAIAMPIGVWSVAFI